MASALFTRPLIGNPKSVPMLPPASPASAGFYSRNANTSVTTPPAAKIGTATAKSAQAIHAINVNHQVLR